EIDLDHGLEPVRRQRGGGREEVAGGTVDDRIELAEPLDRLPDGGGDRIRIADVRCDRQDGASVARGQLVSGPAEHVRLAADDADVRAEPRVRVRDAAADAGASA